MFRRLFSILLMKRGSKWHPLVLHVGPEPALQMFSFICVISSRLQGFLIGDTTENKTVTRGHTWIFVSNNFQSCQFPFQKFFKVFKFSEFVSLLFMSLLLFCTADTYWSSRIKSKFYIKWKLRKLRRLTCQTWQLFKMFSYGCRNIPLKWPLFFPILTSYQSKFLKQGQKKWKE